MEKLKQFKIPFIFAFVGTVISFFLYLSFDKLNPVLMSPIDYDDQVVLLNLENYEAEGFFKFNTFTNRKGHLRVDLYDGVDGCIYLENQDVLASALSVGERETPLKSLENDCVYLHYPHLSQIIHYMFLKVGLLSLDNLGSFYILNILINFVFLFLLTLLLIEISKSRTLSLFVVGLYLTSIAYLEFQFVLYHYSFQMLFLLIYFYLISIRKIKTAMIGSLVFSFVGLDFFIAYFVCNFGLSLYEPRRRKTRLSIFLFHGLLVIGYLYLIVSVIGWNQFIKDLTGTLSHRVGGSSYFVLLFDAFLRQAYTVFGKSFSAVSILASFGLIIYQWKKITNRKKWALFICLLFSINLTLFTPNSAFYHAWYKYVLFLIFLIPLHAIVWGSFAETHRKLGFAVIALLILNLSSLSRFATKMKVSYLNWQHSSQFSQKLDKVFDLYVFPNQVSDLENRWEIFDLRKSIMSPIPPWVSDQVLIPAPSERKRIGFSQGLNFLIKLKENHDLSKIEMIVRGEEYGGLRCLYYRYSDYKFVLVPSEFIIKDYKKGFSGLIFSKIKEEDLIVKISCEGGTNLKISRLWFF